jgi:G-protein signaling modulator 2
MARALYNFGNVYYAQGKNAGMYANQDPGEFPPDVKESLEKAVQYYE